jgi:hypothetical protein
MDRQDQVANWLTLPPSFAVPLGAIGVAVLSFLLSSLTISVLW